MNRTESFSSIAWAGRWRSIISSWTLRKVEDMLLAAVGWPASVNSCSSVPPHCSQTSRSVCLMRGALAAALANRTRALSRASCMAGGLSMMFWSLTSPSELAGTQSSALSAR